MKRINLTYTQPQLDIFFPDSPANRIVIPKGRRFGATRGASHACIEWLIEGMPILWGDTIHGNIDKYVDRYFRPALKKNNIDVDWNSQKKVMKLGDGWIDFQSAQHPENWEGQGYRRIVLNEAGIILADRYLYANAVLPMLIDFPDAVLYAMGVPKGMELSDGTEHPFYTLWKEVEGGNPQYRGQQYSSYDNPILNPASILELEKEIAAMDPQQVEQEIYGRFIRMAQGRPFAFNFSTAKHVKPCEQNKARRMATVIDFNLEPFCGIFAHVWTDHLGPHCHIFKEISIKTGTLDEMAQRIRTQAVHPSLIELTGDRGGDARRLGIKSNGSMFADLIKLIPISVSQLTLRANPTHIQSREDVNFALAHHPDFRIDPSCTGLIRDLLTVAVDEDGEIIKRDRSNIAQQADLLDCLRYLVNAFLHDFKKYHKHAMPVGREVR